MIRITKGASALQNIVNKLMIGILCSYHRLSSLLFLNSMLLLLLLTLILRSYYPSFFIIYFLLLKLLSLLPYFQISVFFPLAYLFFLINPKDILQLYYEPIICLPCLLLIIQQNPYCPLLSAYFSLSP